MSELEKIYKYLDEKDFIITVLNDNKLEYFNDDFIVKIYLKENSINIYSESELIGEIEFIFEDLKQVLENN
jgi:hypothetical protein